jgi:hypothetical protein
MKIALVTGASSGIGFAIVQFLIEQGWKVYGSVRGQKDADRLRATLSDQFEPLIFDVTDDAAIQKAAQRLATEGVKLDALVNNAGIAVNGPLIHLEISELHKQFDVNVLGVIRVTQAFAKHLGAYQNSNHAGVIVNMSSVSAFITQPLLGPYSASKAALEKLSDALRNELSFYGIRVGIVEPGPIKTPIWEKAKTGVNYYEGTDYEPLMRQIDKIVDATEKSALPAVAVAKLVFDIIENRKPKARYMIAPKQFLVKLVAKLPDSWKDAIFKRQFVKLRNGKGTNLRGI